MPHICCTRRYLLLLCICTRAPRTAIQATVSTLFGVTNKAAQSDAPSDASGDVQSISDAELDALLAAGSVDVATLTDTAATQQMFAKHALLSIHAADGDKHGISANSQPSWSIPSSPHMVHSDTTTTTTTPPTYVPLSTALLQMHTPPVHLPGMSPPGSGTSPVGRAPVGMSMMYNSGMYVASSGESDGEMGSPLRMPLAKMDVVDRPAVDRTGRFVCAGL